jgi:hypothetical protein
MLALLIPLSIWLLLAVAEAVKLMKRLLAGVAEQAVYFKVLVTKLPQVLL